METQKLTVRLPVDDIVFLKGYARNRGMTVTGALHRYLCRLREVEETEIHPEILKITGLVPSDLDFKATYAKHLIDKHQ